MAPWAIIWAAAKSRRMQERSKDDGRMIKAEKHLNRFGEVQIRGRTDFEGKGRTESVEKIRFNRFRIGLNLFEPNR